MRNLGVIISEDITFKEHYNGIIATARKVIGDAKPVMTHYWS